MSIVKKASAHWEGDLKMTFGGQETTNRTTMDNTMAVGGRFLKSDTKFVMEGAGEMFGTLMMSYSDEKKKWVSWWFDSMGSEAMESSGSWENNSYVLVSKPTPMMGQDVVFRSTYKKVSETKMGFKLDMQQGSDWVNMIDGELQKK